MRSNTASSGESEPWLAHGSCSPEYAGMLIGNRAGLELLRESIDKALRGGDASITHAGSEFMAVRIVESDPRNQVVTPRRGLSDRTLIWLGGALFFVLIMVLVAGIREIWSWF